MENSPKTYQFIKNPNFLMLRLTGICEGNLKVFKEEVSLLLVEPMPHVIVNCEHLTSLSNDWVREMLVIQKQLKEFDRSMNFIHVAAVLKKSFQTQGIDTAFKMLPNLRDAMADLGLESKKMLDTDFINPFLNATLHVLKVQASISAVAGKVCLKKPGDKYVGDISGIIGIVSDSFNGSVVISFPASTFLGIMSSMLGEECKEINKDIMDGAGEITNMIFGQAKIVLNDLGYGIKTALPSVVSGKDHKMSSTTKGPVVIVPFESSVGSFFVEICLSV